MPRATNICRRCFVLLVWCLSYSTLMAQNEVAREQSSLKGIQAMGFTINVETNASLAGYSEIKVEPLIQMGQQTLKEGGIPLISDKEVQQSDEIPFLHLHINSMDAGQGLVPFALTLHFYQPVKLVLNRDIQTSSITWASSSVGIVSYDQMGLIRDAVKNLIEEFVSDYNQMNGSN